MSVTRTYQCVSTGETYEVEQRITDPSRTMCDRCSDVFCVPKRLIAVSVEHPHFISGSSGGWSATGYSKTESERRAEHALGRKLTKSEK